MGSFTYTVRDAAGAIHKGVLDADDSTIARARLRQQGYFITSLQPARQRRATIPWFLGRGVSLSELTTFTYQLAAMVGAGITLVRSLQALHDETDSRLLRQVIAAVRQDIEAGKPFSQALLRHPSSRRSTPEWRGLARYPGLWTWPSPGWRSSSTGKRSFAKRRARC